MWKSRRSRFFLFALLIIGVSEASAATVYSTNVRLNSAAGSNRNFTAGISTNTDSGTNPIWIDVLGGDGLTADNGAVITLQLYENSILVPGGVSPSSFTTTAKGVTNQPYGSSSLNPLPITFIYASTGTLTLLAIHTGTGTTTTNFNFTVQPGSPAKIIVLAPGMTLDPGKIPSSTNVGYTGTPLVQAPNQPFNLSVYLTDTYYNRVPLADNFSVTTGDLVSVSPLGTLDSTGFSQVSATILAAKITRSFAVADTSRGGITAGTVDVLTNGPEPEEIFPFPSPYDPTRGVMNFRFQLNADSDVTLTVKDRFGEDVHRMGMSAPKGITTVTWDGANDKGVRVAAGVYIAVLEVGGTIKSKKRFGVVK